MRLRAVGIPFLQEGEDAKLTNGSGFSVAQPLGSYTAAA